MVVPYSTPALEIAISVMLNFLKHKSKFCLTLLYLSRVNNDHILIKNRQHKIFFIVNLLTCIDILFYIGYNIMANALGSSVNKGLATRQNEAVILWGKVVG
jgi:hypothetical protein